MERTEYWIRPGQSKAIAFIHGIGAKDPQTYWQDFLSVLIQDKQLDEFGVFVWKYPTHVQPGNIRNTLSTLKRKTLRETVPRIALLGSAWDTTYHTQFREYQDVFLVCHSMGGLVVKSWILDRLEQGQSTSLATLRHIAFYATPHQGAPVATLAGWNKQLKDMQLNSLFIEEVEKRWSDHVVAWKERLPGPDKVLFNGYIPHLVLAGLNDAVVPSKSATIRGMPLTQINGDHSQVIQPSDSNDTRYKVWRIQMNEIFAKTSPQIVVSSPAGQQVHPERTMAPLSNSQRQEGFGGIYSGENQQSVQVIGDGTPHAFVAFPGTLPAWESQTSPSSPSRSARFGDPFPEVWNVSRRHHPFFTGRDQILQRLSDGFRSEEKVGIVPAQALTGLGGLGKTQTAAEYAYRFRKEYQAVLWVRAETQENLVADFKTIAGLLKLPQKHVRSQASLMQTMQEWFRTQADWLLIFDNADNLALVDPFLPRAAQGHLLLTTRARATVAQAHPLVLEPLNPDDGALCLLRRAGLIAWQEQLQDAPKARVDAARQLSRLMDGLPLALEQAGAYIDDTGCGVPGYLQRYQQYRQEIQQLHSGPVPDYPVSVASAWRVSRSMVEQSSPAATELLRLCAYLASEAIPDELVMVGAAALGPVLGPVAANPIALDQIIGLLRKYSLLSREADRETDLTRLSIHLIMQEILLDEMDESTQQLWAARAVRVVARALPIMPWQVLQAHAQNCLPLITRWQMTFPEAKLLQLQVEEAQAREQG